jgi:zinc transport system ATP-binding protein
MSAAPLCPALVAKGVCVQRGGRSVLEDVSIQVNAGEFVCLCGPNGGGKSTFLKAALGLVPVAGGSVHLFDRPAAEARSRVGYLPQRTTFDHGFPATAGELIVANLRGCWPWRLRESERVQAIQALRRVGGEGLIDKPLAGLSGGETQRTFLARALVTEPALLLLDEPTAGVDERGRGDFLDLLAELASSRTVAGLVVTHNRAAIDRIAGRVIYLDRTVVACGRPDEVFGNRGLSPAGHDHLAQASVCEDE